MKILQDNGIASSTLSARSVLLDDAARESSRSGKGAPPRQAVRTMPQGESWSRCSKRWGRLMAKTQAGDSQAYEELLRELDAWLCRYYARRLPYPAAEDARQNTLLAIHAKRHTYMPSKSFGAWVFAIARYKWIDCIRDASRYSALSPDEEIPVEDHGRAAMSAATLDHLLGQLKPAQESVIRLVKLRGLSIASASGATGQSASLVKINIHRGLKKLAALVS
jgi:RNA polymerase sigma factor (sigma-70 family)